MLLILRIFDVVWHPLQIPDQPQRLEGPEHVICNVNLPPEKALATGGFLVLMVVVPGFAQANQRQPQTVTRLVIALIPLLPKLVHDRVNRTRAVVQDYRAQEKPDEER